MKWLIGAIVSSLVFFYILQNLDDARMDQQRQPRASVGRKLATFFFITVITTVLFYWVGNMMAGDDNGTSAPIEGGLASRASNGNNGRALEARMIKSIHQEVDVGAAPF